MLDYPDFVWNLTSFKALHLTAHGRQMPEAVGNLKNLESLELHDLINVPESVANLSCLTELTFMNCPQLWTLPESFGNLAAQVLYLYNCKSISTLPASIGNLKNLKNIILRECTILTQLPSSVGKLTSLENLTVEDCALIELPESV